MFRVGDKIMHPMHGAGIVESVVENKIDGVIREYYVMRLPVRAMVVMIPTHNCAEIGVRPVIDGREAKEILSGLAGVQVDVEQNWNRRYRENMEKIKSGDIMRVAEVVRDLMRMDREKALSAGESKMLDNARQVLISEMILAADMESRHAEELVLDCVLLR